MGGGAISSDSLHLAMHTALPLWDIKTDFDYTLINKS